MHHGHHSSALLTLEVPVGTWQTNIFSCFFLLSVASPGFPMIFREMPSDGPTPGWVGGDPPPHPPGLTEVCPHLLSVRPENYERERGKVEDRRQALLQVVRELEATPLPGLGPSPTLSLSTRPEGTHHTRAGEPFGQSCQK